MLKFFFNVGKVGLYISSTKSLPESIQCGAEEFCICGEQAWTV